MLYSIPDKIAEIPSPKTREIVGAIYKEMEPALTAMENSLVDNMTKFGEVPDETIEGIRNMVRQEGFRILLEKIKDQLEKVMKERMEKGEDHD